MSKKKRNKELTEEDLKKVSGGLVMRSLSGLREVTVSDRDDLAPQDFGSPERMANRPIDITRSVQDNWTPQ